MKLPRGGAVEKNQWEKLVVIGFCALAMPIYKEALTYIFVLFSENYFDSLFAAIGKEDWAEKIENYLTQNDWE
ncbi:17639_t:CDS:2 [Gigaspora margarita]|uniref:17639_t:CDS:1 n=1 Tax=Gigaspora margarita TaxID=4874 RepID=A0ABM8VXE9_GIGMA|nr:17639_t:CDS:2 [Gigaspora margarita]